MRKPLVPLAAILFLFAVSAVVQANPVEFAAPPNGSTISGHDVRIVININSSDKLAVSRVAVSLDGKLVTQRSYTPPITSGNSEFKWDTNRTPNGRHTLKVGVYSGGNVVGSATCDVTVSNTSETAAAQPPKITITSPKNGQVVSGTTPIIIESTDSSGEDPFVSVYVDKTMRSASNVRPYKYDWNTLTVGNGPHYITAQASNDADASTQTPVVKVIVQNPVGKTLAEARAHSSLPALPDLGATTQSESVSQPSTKATPRMESGTAKGSEVARAAAQTPDSADKFEVNQTPASKLSAAPAKELASLSTLPKGNALALLDGKTYASSPSASAPSQSKTVSTKTAVPAAKSAASSEASDPLSTPVLMEKSVGSHPGTSAVSAGVLSTPAVPKPLPAKLEVATASSSNPAQSPALVVKSASSDLTPSANGNIKLSTPAAPSAKPAAAVSKPLQSPVLAPAPGSLASIPTTGNMDNRLVAPMPSAESSASAPLTKPILVARAVQSDVAVGGEKSNVLSTPSLPKAHKAATKPVKKAAVPPAISKRVENTARAKKPVAAVKRVKSASPRNMKMVLIRSAIQHAGGTVNWYNRSKTVKAFAKHKLIKVKIGSKIAKVNSRSVNMGKAAIIRKSRTLVPESFLTGTLGLSAK